MWIYVNFSRLKLIYHVDLCPTLSMSVEVPDGGTLQCALKKEVHLMTLFGHFHLFNEDPWKFNN